ncbi:beta-3-deoxy-D-manno-oct-2-ulosonic acid transferase [Sphingomonas kyeonggiensis]|uniref:Capsular polysaccharide export protein n=1 Tax=Sphingomonas kyeonggiensis TaxID=1268553 RepID=A0A7W6JVK4_9SPHN|nr:beta-3-deoxy-D-manno-oct-2-ulosonic acid transferase [Sphingomonas kyeonggiensis]MBB4099287.1 capsular polysaccharide export protein [Sphingomonas kyeonggiensis]
MTAPVAPTRAAPLLQAPPAFAKRSRAPLAVARGSHGHPPLTQEQADRSDRLIERLHQLRVGGSFWGARPALPPGCTVVKAPGSPTDANATLWAGTEVLAGDIDPWHLLDHAAAVIAPHGDPLAILARLRAIPTTDTATGEPLPIGADARRALAWDTLVVAHDYHEPFTGSPIAVEAAIDLLGEWRRHLEAIAGIGVQFGMRAWKRGQIDRFLTGTAGVPGQARRGKDALARARADNAAVAIWPSRVPPDFEASAATAGVRLARVEDGFLRSLGLGVHLVPPQSIVVDRQGIHYDPARSSDLEALLSEHPFPPALLRRAAALRAAIVGAGIGKYGRADNATPIPLPHDRRSILVVGQVEDDQSVRMGDVAGLGNSGLLKRARALAPDAFLLYKPHPDTLAGHRRGALDREARILADRILDTPCPLAPLLDQVDEVHVLTSLAGFEALLRERTVLCHGIPFYAGWGLTRDLVPVPRRTRRLDLDALVAATLLLYPLYLDPETGLPCPAERLVECLASAAPHVSFLSRLRRIEGKARNILRQAT